MKKRDQRLIKIADWLNHAIENERIWIVYIWVWYDRNTLQPLRRLRMSKTLFADLCRSQDIFAAVTSGPEELSEDEKWERKEQLKDWFDPSTRKPYVEPPDPIVPFLDEHGVFRNDLPLSGKARKNIVEILPVIVELWEEGVLDAFLNHQRLKQCPECNKWFVVSKTDQMFCQTPTTDRLINPRTGKPRQPCRMVAYQETEEYKERTRKKMADWRAAKKAKQRKAAVSRKAAPGPTIRRSGS
jgi:hypothetical protein